VSAVAGVAGNPALGYAGACAGGLWQTIDAGQFWSNVSDGFFQRASVGAVAVAPSDPNVLYVGMGEVAIRGNVSHGDGVYKSTDAGRTWRHLGLSDSRHIGRIRVHPTNPDIAWLAALGHAHGPNTERGVYRTLDGGASWQPVLVRSEQAGAYDLTLDPTNPRVLYASFWEMLRGPWSMTNGGPGTSLYRTLDGGDTWQEITGSPGFAAGRIRKISVSASVQPGRLWALVAGDQGGVYRSDDYGASWRRLATDVNLYQRAWYYVHVIADPVDPDTVWVCCYELFKSIDGGKSFEVVPVPHSDLHDLWIDPLDPAHLILGGDGGACVSLNGGLSWSSLYTQPTAEIYHVTVDNRTPYRVYGAQQDNTCISLPSRSRHTTISQQEWFTPGGGDNAGENAQIAVRPDNPDIIYATDVRGQVSRYDRASGQWRTINPWPESQRGWASADKQYRFHWNAPILLAPDDPDTLYVASQFVHRSTDEGQSWTVISPDLTRSDPATLERVDGENLGYEVYGTVYVLAASSIDPAQLWTGSDDGLVHRSGDRGVTWENVTPTELPEWSHFSSIDPSPHDPATVWVAAHRYKLDDFQPLLFVSQDSGRSWRSANGDLPAGTITRVLREDPKQPKLLYLGTETGVLVSFDGGEHWTPLRPWLGRDREGSLPVVPVHDLVIVQDDLVAATHGRSFWILDDLTPLRWLAEHGNQAPQLLQPRDHYSLSPLTSPVDHSSDALAVARGRAGIAAGANPPDGALIHYLLPASVPDTFELEILDERGELVRSFSQPRAVEDDPDLPAEPGLNRFVWDLRYPGSSKVAAESGDNASVEGPRAVSGTYHVRLTIGDWTASQPLRLLPDPGGGASRADLQAQFELACRVRDTLSSVNQTIDAIRSTRSQLEYWSQRPQSPDEVVEQANGLIQELGSIEETLVQVKAVDRRDGLNYPCQLNARLQFLYGVVTRGNNPPTTQAEELAAELGAEAQTARKRYQDLIDERVRGFNERLAASGLPAIDVRL
jgi:photosystem II stability/assembly factor-like uncharacterized protein